jgi:hypothetical protein
MYMKTNPSLENESESISKNASREEEITAKEETYSATRQKKRSRIKAVKVYSAKM